MIGFIMIVSGVVLARIIRDAAKTPTHHATRSGHRTHHGVDAGWCGCLVNPTTGLPMVDGQPIDVGGNLFCAPLHNTDL